MVTGSTSDPLGWGLTVYARAQCHLTSSGQGLKCAGQTPLEDATMRFSEPAPAVARAPCVLGRYESCLAICPRWLGVGEYPGP